MNRLFSKLKDFGLIFSVNPSTEEAVINVSQTLKTADIPVVLFPFYKNQTFNSIRISNENADMFLGAHCTPDFEVIQKATASGAHFIVCENLEGNVISQCTSAGIDLIVSVASVQAVNEAVDSGAEAVMVNTNKENSTELISHVLKIRGLTLFLMGKKENLPFDEMRNHQDVAAFIVDNPFESSPNYFRVAHEILHQMLGLRFTDLTLTEDSVKIDEAKVFCALSNVPLILKGERDLLTIDVKDMDRTICHLKWKNIYMDPLTAKMDGSTILSTELYNNFLGWTVKLINRS